MTNIIARFGAGNAKALMLCAHWDSRPRADRDPDLKKRTEPVPAANDGASGVAILLEVARVASQSPPPRPLLIVLFDGEDMGRSDHPEEFAYGSRYWAAHPVPEPPGEAILLDMVGKTDSQFLVEQYSEANSPQLRRALWTLAVQLDLPAFVERLGPAIEDDHVPLQNAGIPAIDIIDFDYPYWHTTSDTPDKCSTETLEQVGKLLVGYLYSG
jgi:glutaminyl-peptide cyclotransferase